MENDAFLINSFQIPQANSVASLLLPHFLLGIGIGTLDVALVPLLASIVDSKYNNDDDTSSGSYFAIFVTGEGKAYNKFINIVHSFVVVFSLKGFGESSYGTIYAIQQMRQYLCFRI